MVVFLINEEARDLGMVFWHLSLSNSSYYQPKESLAICFFVYIQCLEWLNASTNITFYCFNKKFNFSLEKINKKP